MPTRLALAAAVVLMSAVRAEEPLRVPAGKYILGFGRQPLKGGNLVEMPRPFRLQPGQFILSGGPSPTDPIEVDDDLEVHLGDRKLFIDDDTVRTTERRREWGCTYAGEPILFALPPSGKLRILAIDHHPSDAALGDLYLHRHDGAKVRIHRAVQEKSAQRLPNTFVNREFTLEKLFPNPPTAAVLKLSDGELKAAWKELGDPDIHLAFLALWRLVATGEPTVALVKAQVKPVAPADPMRVLQLISDLGDRQYRVREQAMRRLEAKGETAKGGLREAQNRVTEAEVRRRLATLLTAIRSAAYPPATVRALRAVEVLERIGTPEAANVLAELATGAPEAALTKAAAEAAQRLKR